MPEIPDPIDVACIPFKRNAAPFMSSNFGIGVTTIGRCVDRPYRTAALEAPRFVDRDRLSLSTKNPVLMVAQISKPIFDKMLVGLVVTA